MADRCPNSTELGKGFIKDYKIDFTKFSKKRKGGVADIVYSEGEIVCGVIYAISESDLAKLDAFEGYPTSYSRKSIPCFLYPDSDSLPAELLPQKMVKTIQGQTPISQMEALVYEVVNKSPTTIYPHISYLKLMQDAAKEHCFPASYQKKLQEYGVEIRNRLNASALDFFLETYDFVNNQGALAEACKDTEEFGGAGLVITGSIERKIQLKEQYEDLVVLTPYWKELSWLVSNIYESEYVEWLMDYQSKYLFFDHFGRAAKEYQKMNPNEDNSIGICKACVTAAYALLTQGGLLHVE
jgi:gamma-glutamylcyclotransferase (GGCT)/AIG2-like uncharacterized protein YtfP